MWLQSGPDREVAGPEITPKTLKWQSRASGSQSLSSEASRPTAPAPHRPAHSATPEFSLVPRTFFSDWLPLGSNKRELGSTSGGSKLRPGRAALARLSKPRGMRRRRRRAPGCPVGGATSGGRGGTCSGEPSGEFRGLIACGRLSYKERETQIQQGVK